MVQFLSPEWFERVEAATDDLPSAESEDRLVLGQVVTGTPDGEVHYRVLLAHGKAWILRGEGRDAHVTFTTSYPTAAAIASGELSPQVALSGGQIRVGGNTALLARRGESTAVCALPDAVRRETTY